MKIYDLANIPDNLLLKVGGKARGLNQLINFGFNVPNGFIICDFYDEYEEAYEYLLKQNLGCVAVRSSATQEDGSEYSSAGQFETVLNVKTKEEFINAIKVCIASLTSARVKAYAKTFLKDQKSEMTLVVQKMINPKTAGVLFTQDNFDKETVLIEAVRGLGENLVSGKESAEQYFVKGNKIKGQNNKLLNEKEVLKLAKDGKKAEKAFNNPMDIEWAIDDNDLIYYLQARPITTTEEVTIDELDCNIDANESVMTTCNIREVMPGAVTPLTLSTTMFCLDYGMRRIMQKNGCTKHVDDLPPFSCISNYYNCMFFNLTNTYRIIHSCYGADKGALELSICGRTLDDFPDINIKNTFFLKRLWNTFFFLKYAMGCKGALKGSVKIANKVEFDLSKDAKDIYEQCNKNFPLFMESMFYHYWTSWYSGTQCNMPIMMEAKNFESREELQAKMAGALTNIENIESAQIIIDMKNLARKIVEDNSEARKFSADKLVEYLQNSQGEVKKSFDNFMNRHGHRGIREPEMRYLSWKQDIKAFANSLLSVLTSDLDEKKTQEKTWEEYAEEILCHEKGIKKKIFHSFIVKARKGVYYREFTKSKSMYVTNKFKEAYKEIGEKLAKAGILPDSDLIYFVTHQEIKDLLEGKNSLVKKAIARRRLYTKQCELKFPEVFIGKPEPLKPKVLDTKQTEYKGTPASRGVASGKARIVRSIEDANKLETGEIMIAGFSDIGWSPYYCKIAALVTEIGSSLSHGIVVAREYALPTITNCTGIMDAIKTGDYITVDGDTGIITVER